MKEGRKLRMKEGRMTERSMELTKTCSEETVKEENNTKRRKEGL